MATPLNQRANHLFLSHSSRDAAPFVDGLYDWLTASAGLKVWYDRNLVSGQVSDNLERGIDGSRNAAIVLSKNSLASAWVELECSRLLEERARYPGEFRIATLRLDGVDAPGLLKSFKHIDVPPRLDPKAAALLLDTLFGGQDHPTGKSVYLSRGWRPAERPAADRLSHALKSSGLRAVADYTDQPHFDPGRVGRILGSTGGLVAILPHRGDGATSRYAITEIELASRAGLPTLVFAHQGVALSPERPIDRPILFGDELGEATAEDIVDRYGDRIEQFVQSLKPPAIGDHIFIGHPLDAGVTANFEAAQTMLMRLSGFDVEVGSLVLDADVQPGIVRRIREAAFCIVDITSLDETGALQPNLFKLNSCIEAGIAMGAGKDLYITCQGDPRSPPFMFRHKQVHFYRDGLDLVGRLARIAATHRRMVL